MTTNPSLTTSDNHDMPASEWASNTISALGQAEDTSHSQSAHSVPESPGLGMPGSFPTSKQSHIPDVQYVQEVASGALKTATQYAQTAARGAQTAVQTAGEKVGEYLPTSVASYLASEPDGTEKEASHNSTLPSQETSQNYHPSTSGGVGPLPGPPGEIGVAVLPDERTGGVSVDQAARDSVASTDIAKTSTSNNNHPSERHTGYIPGVLQDDTSPGEERRLESLQGERLGKSTDAGTIPGSATELDGGGASTDASVRTLPGSSSTPPFGHVAQTNGRAYAFSRDEEKLFGGSEKKDADLPETKDTNKTVATDKNASRDTRAVGSGSGGLAGAGSASQFASEVTAVPKEGGFMHKVKGEMKVLSGKMSHNKTKVEEGRKMMGKN
jgi:hypothetical protein